MAEVDDFLRETWPRLIDAETALHHGDVEPRLRMWSRNDPVTVFGAWSSDAGWQDVSKLFRDLASRFSDSTSYEIELITAGASGDLAYTVAYEHNTVSVNGEPRTHCESHRYIGERTASGSLPIVMATNCQRMRSGCRRRPRNCGGQGRGVPVAADICRSALADALPIGQ